MKRETLLKMFAYMGAVAVFAGCSTGGKEVTVETVEDTFETELSYYAVGSVLNLDGGGSLEGVAVTVADVAEETDSEGDYMLTLGEKGKTYTLSFAKSGYSSETRDVTIASSATNHSFTTINSFKMSPVAVPQTVTAADVITNSDGEEVIVVEDQLTETATSISIPASLVADGKEVTITVASYEPEIVAASTTVVAETETAVSVPIAAVSIASTVSDAGDDSFTVSAVNPLGTTYHFDDVQVSASSESATKASGSEVTFDANSASYVYLTSSLKSSYEFVISPKVSTYSLVSDQPDGNTVNGESSFVYNNEGSTSAVYGVSLEVKTQLGWEYVSGYSVSEAVASALPSANSTDRSTIGSSIESVIVAREGKSGLTTYTTTSVIDVAGNTNYYYQVNAKTCERSYSVDIATNAAGTEFKTIVVKLKSYYGSTTSVTKELYDSHSGGYLGSN